MLDELVASCRVNSRGGVARFQSSHATLAARAQCRSVRAKHDYMQCTYYNYNLQKRITVTIALDRGLGLT